MNQKSKDKVAIRGTPQILSNTIQNMVAGLTGLAASDRKDLLLSFGHILQRLRGVDILSAILKEWEQLKDKGAIKEDYEKTEQHLNCLHELLEFLESDIPDDIRIKVLKKILLIAATEKFSNREDILPHQYMILAKKLSSGALQVLFIAYSLFNKKTKTSSAIGWLEIIADNSPLKTSGLVELYEDELMRFKLLSNRVYTDRSGVLSHNFRLFTSAIDFCEFIENYDDLKENL